MSFKAVLIVDEKEVNVLQFSFDFDQKADVTGRPSHKTIFTGLKLKIETRKDLDLIEWSIAPDQPKQLELHILPNILGSGSTRKITLHDAHLISFDNHFSSNGDRPMYEDLEIKAAGFEDSTSSGVYSAYWRTTFPISNVETTTLDTGEKEVTRYYLTNVDDEEVDEYEVGDKIFLNIETKNRIDDKLTIYLEDKTHDFLYQGTVLENDVLKDYVISSDQEKIELEVISPQSQN